MSVDIDISGLPTERIVFGPSPLAELGAALHVLSEPAHHPGLHGWATTTAAGLKPDLLGRMAEAEFLWRSTRSDILLPRGSMPPATLAEELDEVDALDDEAYVAAALEINASGCTLRSGGGRSPLVDEAARDAALERASARGPRQLGFAQHLLKDPATVRTWVRRLLEDCDEAFFADVWQRVRPQLAADARGKTDLLRRKGLADALEAVSPTVTIEETARSRRISIDKLADGWTAAMQPGVEPGVTFVPSTFGWPHLIVRQAPGWRPVVGYPVSAPELRPGPRTSQLMEKRLMAVAHPARIRLCWALARAPYTTSELAQGFGLSASEVSRHLKTLREAEMLTTRRHGRYVQHQLDVTVVARLGSDFLESILR
ncbi:DUF5937 family protein [Streptomyces sp. NPDC050732]|uniref:DUF5937 family protein n=1 Tax=Streptomyces sp. NPDC050732 TaxID=3154632 RepID=UPI003420B86A